MPAEIRHHGCRNRNVTESATVTFDRNRNYAESVKIYSFGAETETETEIRSVFRDANVTGCWCVSCIVWVKMTHKQTAIDLDQKITALLPHGVLKDNDQ